MLVVQDFVYHAAGHAQEAAQAVAAAVDVVELAGEAAAGAVVGIAKEAAAAGAVAVRQDVLLGVQRHVHRLAVVLASETVRTDAIPHVQEHVGLRAVESAQDRTTRTRRKGREMETNKRETMAKAKAYLSIQKGKTAKEIVDEYIETIGEATQEQIINTIFQAVYANKGPAEVLSELAQRYPEQKELVAQLSIALFISLNPQPTNLYESIQEFEKDYGETRDILLMELDYLVSHNFMKPERMQYIVLKLSESGE